ncbi:MAG: right-handed parallel beta-helix repeat-containing protein [Candidatus Hodarchaeales archaeon]
MTFLNGYIELVFISSCLNNGMIPQSLSKKIFVFIIFLLFLPLIGDSFQNDILISNSSQSSPNSGFEEFTHHNFDGSISSLKLTSFTTRDPIKLTGNFEVNATAFAEGWQGNGSAVNPFIIENYYITNSSANTHGIEIDSTSYHFIIRNNYISVSGYSSSGIDLSFISGIAIVENNTVIDNPDSGIFLYYCHYSVVRNNTVINNRNYGIGFSDNNYLLVEDNLIMGQTNTSNPNYGGMYMAGSVSHNIVRNNNISNNYNGIRMFSNSVNNTFENNFFSNNSGFSLYAGSSSESAKIVNNTFTKNPNQAIWVSNSEYHLIADNIFDNNYVTPVWISSFGNYNTIINNTVTNNAGEGIWINSIAFHNIISNNFIKNNSGGGIWLSSGILNATVTKNTIINNEIGIYASITESYIFDNYIKNSVFQGLYISGSSNSTIENNFILNGGSNGIYISGSNNATVTNNTVIGFANYGINVQSSDPANHIYLNNFLHNNNGGIQGYSSGTIQNWNNSLLGNFWLDHFVPDNDFNNISDVPYTLDGANNIDYLPSVIWTGIRLPPEIILAPSNTIVEAGTIGNNLTWIGIDEETFVTNLYIDGEANNSYLWISRTPTVIPIDGLELGIYNFTLEFVDFDQNKLNSSVLVTVVDTTPPNISTEIAYSFMEDSLNNIINWTLTDFYPFNYTILKDGAFNSTGSWINNETISLDVTGLPIGAYNYTLIANDTSSNFNSSTIWVMIYDGVDPVVNQPDNISYEYGYSPGEIQWIVTDNHADNYTIYLDGVFFSTGNWTSGSNITVVLSNNSPGAYNYTLIVFDESGLNTSSIVFVFVLPDTTRPTVDQPADFSVEHNATGEFITWVANDFFPASYSILINGSLETTGSWNNSYPIVIPVNTSVSGLFNYTIIVYDETNNIRNDTVFVTINPFQGLAISHPVDVNYEEGQKNVNISWTLIGNKTGTYKIYNESILIVTDTWTNDTVVALDVSNLAIGTYNYTIIANSSDNVTIMDTVFVTVVVDSTSPTISDESDIFYLENSLNNNIVWSVFDLNPDTYVLYKNGTEKDSGPWTNNNSLTMNVDGQYPGYYNYTLIIYDLNGQSANDTVWVLVIDNSVPELVSTPTNTVNYPEETDFTLSWLVTDYSAFNYTVYLDGQEFTQDFWQNYTSVNVDFNLQKGSYSLIIVFSDIYGLTVQQTVTLEILDVTVPVLNSPEDITFEEGSIAPLLIWNFTDKYSGTYEVYRNGSLRHSGPWTNKFTYSLDVSLLTPGIYNYTIIVIDDSGNTATDTVIITVTTSTPTSTSSVSVSVSVETSSQSSTDSTITTTASGFTLPFLIMLIGIFVLIRFKRK